MLVTSPIRRLPGRAFLMSARKIFPIATWLFFWLARISSGEQAVIFAHYNVENYLEMNRREGGQSILGSKPEAEKAPLIRIITEIHPDILGVAEMGPPDQFEEFQLRLIFGFFFLASLFCLVMAANFAICAETTQAVVVGIEDVYDSHGIRVPGHRIAYQYFDVEAKIVPKTGRIQRCQ